MLEIGKMVSLILQLGLSSVTIVYFMPQSLGIRSSEISVFMQIN